MTASLHLTHTPAPSPRSIATRMRAHDGAAAAKQAALEEELAARYPLYKRVVEETSDGLVVLDRNAVITFCNPAAAVMFSSTCDDLVGREFGFPLGTLNEPTQVEIFTGGKPSFVEMLATAISWHDQDASLIVLRDVTARREAETLIQMQSRALEASINGIFITDKSGIMLWSNQALAEMSGYAVDEMTGQSIDIFKSGKHAENFYADIWLHLLAGDAWKGRIINRRKDGSLYTAEQTVTPILDATGRLSHFVAIQEDISERLKTQGELVRLAEFDTLTGLPNRHVFMERLQAAIERAQRADAMVAVMMLDIDNFKTINNTLGHSVGDALLVAVSDKIGAIMRTTDTLAHLGGDEFGLVLENVKDMAAASRMMRKILDSFHRSLTIDGHVVEVTASIGIAAYPKDDTEAQALMRQAELAMYQAKAGGRDAFRYFDREMDADIRRRVKLEADLRRAVEGNQLWLAYQPQMDLASNRIVGAEALIRWNHPERGLVSPGEFIPIAEASGLILPIGDWIIEEICRQYQIWQAVGLPALRLGFNVSGVQFRQKNLAHHVTSTLNKAGLSASDLDIEITETVAMERSGRVQENVDLLTAAGVSMSVDDFGTGYSSLSNLQAFPVCRLKVDASFVRGIGQSRDDEKIVEAVIRLGQSLGLTLVAEGVETPEQLQFLRDRGCDEIQGYFISKPLPPEQFRAFTAGFTGPPL